MQLSSHALAFGLCIPLAALAGFLINEYLWRTKVLPKHVKRAYLTGLRRSRLESTPANIIRMPRPDNSQIVSRNMQAK